MVVTEIAQFDIKPGMEQEFEEGARKAVPLFRRAKGCTSMKLLRSVEHPATYRLFVRWATIENHTVDFRESSDFQEWRKLVAGFFVEPPQVHHEQKVL